MSPEVINNLMSHFQTPVKQAEPEAECECRMSGDSADASECELHGGTR